MDDRRLADEVAATLSEAQAALPPAGPDTLAVIRRRYRRGRQRRAGLASVAAAVLVLAVTLTGSQLIRGGNLVSPPTGDGAATLRVWSIVPPVRNSALEGLVERYGEETGVQIELSFFGNEEYKQRLRGVGDDSEGPDVFLSWGGAELARLARAGRLVDLTGPLRERPGVAERFLPDVLAGAQVDGRQYGLPMSGTHPVVLFYNRDVFAQAGLRPPDTYAELLRLVDRFSADGIIPLSLGGAQGWTELMYVMYLAERIGGPGTTADIVAGRPDAWTKPAVLRALREARELAERGAFGTDFASIGYDDGTAGRRLATGEAAMQLMGTWEYPTQLGRNADFVLDGRLGWVPFPTVAGGVGDPADLVGVPAQYFSVVESSQHRAAAVDFVRAVAGDAYLDDLVADGEVPPVVDAAARLRGTPHAEFTTSISALVSRAPSYTLAWDQAVDPSTASRLNSNLRRLFRSELTAEQFAAAMSN